MSTECKTSNRNLSFFALLLVLASGNWGNGVVLADPPPSEEGEIEIEMDGLWGGGDELELARSAALVALCRQLAWDDHGDVWPCATQLTPGLELIADLGDSNGLDRDLFTFRLGVAGDGRRHQVELALVSRISVDLHLRSADGTRITPESFPSVTGKDFLARFRGLSSGLYFLEVSGNDGGAGLYALRLDARSD